MKRFNLALISVLVAILLGGCSEEKTEQEIEQRTAEFYEALLMEDEKEIMSYFTKDNPNYYEYYEQIAYNIKYFNFNYDVKGIKITRQSRKDYVVETLVNVSGVDEKDKSYQYTSSEKMHWIKKDGEWRLYEYQNEFAQ